MNETRSVTDILNELLGAYWTARAQHHTHVALIDSWAITGLARSMEAHIADEQVTIDALLNRLLDLRGQPTFSLGRLTIGTSLREILDNDLELQRGTRPGLNTAAEAAAAAHDATTRVLLEGILAAEEEHLTWLETELDLLQRLGEPLYLASRLPASGSANAT